MDDPRYRSAFFVPESAALVAIAALAEERGGQRARAISRE